MGHMIQALVVPGHLSQAVRGRLGAVTVPLELGLALAPITDDVFDRLMSESGAVVIDPFERLTSGLVAFAMELSAGAGLAYVETEYFGGVGTQSAIAWRGRKTIVGPAAGESAINAALRGIGASRAEAMDEFDSVGLGRYRSNDAWAAASCRPG